MKKYLFLYLLTLTLFYSPAVLAQEEVPTEEEEPSFSLAGSVDAYFHTTLGTYQPVFSGNTLVGKVHAPSTSFANLKGFSLGMVNLIASYQGEKVGFVGDLVFGPRGRDAVFGNTYTGQGIVNQLFAYYKFSDAVTLNLGQFNTFLGYEVISPAVNFHYSTSYMFSWGPFNHTGLRADFDLGGGIVAKLALMNPTDIVEFNPVNTYTLGGQIGYSSDGGGIWFNVLFGDQDGKIDEDDPLAPADSEGSTLQLDLTTGWNLSDAFYLGANATLRSVGAGEVFDGTTVTDAPGDASGFMGVALYPKVTLSESTSIGLRAEYFAVNNAYLGIFGLDANGDGSVIDLTLSANLKSGNFTFIPELRMDMTSEDSFLNADNEITNTMMSVNMAAVYKF